MKKVILAAALLFSLGMSAQEGTTQEKPKKNDVMKQKDHIMMKDGKVWVMQNGKTTAMEKEMQMSNGTKVSTNGQVLMADGTSSMMKEGDMMHMDGMVTRKVDKK